MSRYSTPPRTLGKPTGMFRTKEQMAQDSSPIKFGKYKNKTWNDVAEIDPQYIVWAKTEIVNRNEADMPSMPLANWCGYVEKKPTPQPAPRNFDDYDDDIPF